MSLWELKTRSRWIIAEIHGRVRQLLRAARVETRSRALDLYEIEDRVLMSAAPMTVAPEAADVAPIVASAATIDVQTAVPIELSDSEQLEFVLTAVDHQLTDDMTASALPLESNEPSLSSSVAPSHDDNSSSEVQVSGDSSPGDTVTGAEIAGATVVDVAGRNDATEFTVHVRRELVFVDPQLAGYESLLNDLWSVDEPNRQIDVVLLASQQDGVEQVTQTLAGYTDLDAVHFVTQGTDHSVKLGSTWLQPNNLVALSGQIVRWGGSLTSDGSLLFYGSELGTSLAGQNLLDSLQALTGAEIAASTDNMGSAILDGRWMSSSVRHELVILDPDVQNSAALRDLLVAQQEAGRDLELFVLDANRDGFKQIAEILTRYQNLDAVHVFSHATDHGLQLGSTWLDAQTLDAHAAVIQDWQRAFDIDADLLLYGCDLAASDSGRSLINTLGQWTGTDVAASKDLTGTSWLGGNWNLEYTSGHIETAVAAGVELQRNWVGLMSVTVDASSSGSTNGQSSLTVAHTTSGTNRLMVVGVSIDPHGDRVSSVTYNGINLTLVGTEEESGSHSRVEIWALVAPTTGTHNVIVNLTGTNYHGVSAGVITFTDVNQTSPLLAFASAFGTSGTASVTVPSATDDVVFSTVHMHNGSGLTPGAGQTEYWDLAISNTNGSASVEAGAVSVASSWTVASSDWSIAAVSIQADTNTAVKVSASPVQDAYIRDSSPTTNNGTAGSLIIDRETTDLQRTLLQFDLSSIPAGATIASARIKLQSTAIDGLLNIDAYELQESWVEGSTTWNERSSGTSWSTAGGAYNATPLDSLSTAVAGLHVWDITTLAQSWLDGTSQNYGIMVASPDGGGNRTVTYDSREGTVAPVLEIIYTPNTAPTLDATKSPTLSSENEDAGPPSGAIGTLVSSLVDFASPSGQVDNVTDSDSGSLLGIAITVADTANGSWYYSINGGANWNTLGAVSNNSSRLLAANANTRVYFQPNADFNGMLPSAITFRAWDQTTGGNGTLADTSANGGATAFSATTDTASLVVNAVNDAPTLSVGAVFSSINEDNFTNPGNLVSTFANLAEDVDAGALKGVAVTSVDNSNGEWQYTLDGSTWFAVGNVSTSSARLLPSDATSRIRFVPNLDWNGTTGLTQYKAWDQTSGTAGGLVDVTVNGGSTAFSTGTSGGGITVAAVNDSPVLTSNGGGSTASVSLAENITAVTTVTSSDIDGGTLVYSISGGADATKFNIISTTGVLTFATAPDFESPTDIGGNNVYDVQVTVSDGFGLTDVQDIAVTVNAANDNSPVITSNGGGATAFVSTTENSTAVTTVTATDTDLPTQTLTFSISGGADADKFLIDDSTGVLTFISAPNFESPTDVGSNGVYNVQVTVGDGVGLTDLQDISITVTDTDEFDVGAVSDADAMADAVIENTPTGSMVGIDVSASDVDGSNNTITYSLDDSASGQFAIDETTGVVTVASSIDREAGATRSIIVRATSADGSATTQSYVITINDADEFNITPISDSNAAQDEVTENAGIGTVIGITAFGTDADATTNSVTYTLDDDSAGQFDIDITTGIVTVAGAIDRDVGPTRSITVRATSADGSTTTRSFTIAILDVDEFDITPLSDSDATQDNVIENASVGTVVGITAFASDADATANAISYSLDDASAGQFAIDSTTGVVTVAGLINREVGATRSITVRATSADGSTTTQFYVIAIYDVDEFNITPLADSDTASNNVTENSSVGTVVGVTVFASDADATTNAVIYSLDDDSSGQFAIDGTTGVVTVAGTLDREVGATRSIVVRATSADGSATTQSYSITINDVDEFDVTLMSDSDAAPNNVTENASVGSAVGITAFTSDADATTNAISYSLDDASAGQFAIDSTTGVVTVAGLIDREVGATRSITVRATSADGSTATQSYDITINDVDEVDVTLISDSDTTPNGINENASVGTTVGITAFTSDADSTTNAISYSLDDASAGQFAIDSTTGVVMVAGPIDREAGATRSIMVRATSADGSTTTQFYVIAIYDVNEFNITPLADNDTTSNNVTENPSVGTVVGVTAFALDGDATTNAVIYSLDDDSSGQFDIDGTTGVVTVAGTLDREVGATRSIVVRATSADGSATTQAYSITINDVDEFDVTLISDSDTTPNSINENASVGTTVGITAFTSDADATTNAISYSLDDASAGQFAIDSTTGVVMVAGAIDREAGETRSITVRATSTDGSAITQSYVITINDVDEFNITPLADSDTALNNVAENASVGTVVGVTAFASDADATTNAITYSLDDSSSGRFVIDGTTGVVTVAGALDREASATHSITVRATSTDGSTTTRGFTINVIDLNDNLPVIASGQVLEVSEFAAVNDSAGVVSASDIDVVGSLQNWQIIAGNVGGVFVINATTGEIAIASPVNVDYETTPIYTLTLTVFDGIHTAASETVVVNVLNVNEAPNNGISAPQTVAEDSRLVFNSINGNAITISDVDVGSGLLGVQLSVTHGTLTLGSFPNLSFGLGDGTNDREMIIVGKATDLNAALEGLMYAPDPDFNGSETLLIQTRDFGNSGLGGEQLASDSISISVSPVDELPLSNYNNNSPSRTVSPSIPSGGLPDDDDDDGLAVEAITPPAFEPRSSRRNGSGGGGANPESNEALLPVQQTSPLTVPATVLADTQGNYLSKLSGDVGRMSNKNAASGLSSKIAMDQVMASMFNYDGAMWAALNSFTQDVDQAVQSNSRSMKLMVGTTATVGGTLTVGYVLWLLRGGTLIASMVSTLPAWTMIDPLPILDSSDLNPHEDDDESLNSLIESSGLEQM